MIDNKDFDFVKEKFDGDGIKAPESLSTDNMMKLLENESDQNQTAATRQPARKRRWFRPAVSIAACAALAITLIPFINFSGKTGDAVASGDLIYFKSYDELSGKIKDMTSDVQEGIVYEKEELIMGGAATGTQDMQSSPVMNSAKEESVDSDSHSQTYTQVEGVDEADIVKTDGKYIYFSSYMENQVIIAKARKGKAKRVASINAKEIGDYIEDMYLSDGKLIVIGSAEKDDKSYTTATIFDISDPETPAYLYQYSQAGALLSSRLIGSNLCLVTNDYIYIRGRHQIYPYVYYNKESQKMPIEDICCFPDATTPAYTIVGCMDVSSDTVGKSTVKTKAVLGGSSEIYCNDRNLYITASSMKPGTDWIDRDMQTSILKVSIRDGNVKYKKTAVVKGTVNNQFSMDESNGYFKIAVTSNRDGEDANTLYIFDKDMKEVGSVKNFARGEHIEAVRYIKDKAYVITYEQTDPLFIIDLKDPTDPVIEGHVKITGFSTLLVPVGEDYLLGLGFSTEEIDDPDIDMEATDGVKLSLFDIKDPSTPKVVDAREFSGMYSEVQYNHKALLVGPEGTYYAIPYEDDNMGIMVFSAGNGKLSHFKKLETEESVMRCIYIGDYIYGVCADDSIEGFKID